LSLGTWSRIAFKPHPVVLFYAMTTQQCEECKGKLTNGSDGSHVATEQSLGQHCTIPYAHTQTPTSHEDVDYNIF